MTENSNRVAESVVSKPVQGIQDRKRWHRSFTENRHVIEETDLLNDEATAIAARAVQSAVKRDIGSGNGVFLAEVTGDGVDIRGHTDFSEVL